MYKEFAAIYKFQLSTINKEYKLAALIEEENPDLENAAYEVAIYQDEKYHILINYMLDYLDMLVILTRKN